MKILLATPASGGLVHWKYFQSVLTELFLAGERLDNMPRYDLAMYVQGGHSGLAKDRGVIASFALRNDFDKLFFVDADQSFMWADCKKLFDSNKPVVGGMVALKSYPIRLNFHPRPEDKHFFAPENNCTSPQGVRRWREAQAANPLKPFSDEMQVGALGTGFMCIDVKVLRDMVTKKVVEPFIVEETRNDIPMRSQAWDFFSTGVLDGTFFGEDYGFAILAQRAGHTVWVNTTVTADHHGQHTYQVPKETWAPPTHDSNQMFLPLSGAQ